MDFQIEFTNKDITPYGGLILLKNMIYKSGLIEYLTTLPLPQPG